MIEARLGNTRYTIEDQPGGATVRVTRHNADGVKYLHFPIELIKKYVQERASDAMLTLIFKEKDRG